MGLYNLMTLISFAMDFITIIAAIGSTLYCLCKSIYGKFVSDVAKAAIAEIDHTVSRVVDAKLKEREQSFKEYQKQQADLEKGKKKTASTFQIIKRFLSDK